MKTPDATSSIYTTNLVTTGDAASYDVVVSGACSPAATSTAATLTVNTAPSISSNPTSTSSCVGEIGRASCRERGKTLAEPGRTGGMNVARATGSRHTV